MQGKKGGMAPVLVVLAIIGGVALFAAVSRSFWWAIIGGGPLVLGMIVAAAFVLGVLLGFFLRR